MGCTCPHELPKRTEVSRLGPGMIDEHGGDSRNPKDEAYFLAFHKLKEFLRLESLHQYLFCPC